MTIDNPYIQVSGVPTFQQNQIAFPSGAFGISVNAFLAEINATFGFNAQPHRFDLQFIPDDFSESTLPTIGSGVSFTIGDFYIAGRIKHADYSKSTRGRILSVSVEDIREDLNDTYLDTYGIFANNDSPSVGVVDIRYWYVQTRVVTNAVSRSVAVRDLKLIEENGASYEQIYEAIDYFENTLGTISNIKSKLPDPDVIDAQLPLDPKGYRFRFRAQPLLSAIAKIMNDISYDFYYNMAENKINVINRKYAVNISEDAIPIASDTAPIISSKYGKDEAERPTTIRMYGGQMEGVVGSGTLMTQSGAYGLNSTQYDMGIVVGRPRYVPGWAAKLKYYGPDGFTNEYQPTDRELAMALKSLEHWAMEVGLDNRIADQTIDPETGLTADQISVTGSGLGLIPSRRQDGRSWIIEWYNRVRQHATNNYGRTYILDPDGDMFTYIDDIDVVAAAWCNLENQTEDGSFADNYKISEEYKFLSPFWDADSNKLRGFIVVPVTTKWGIDGEQTPARFTEWNESENNQFVPIEVRKFDTTRQKFKEEFLTPIEENEKGIVVRLPQIMWDPDQDGIDSVLQGVSRLNALSSLLGTDSTIDTPNPYKIVTPPSELTGVAIPISVRRRYGFKYPTVWASGTGTAREVIVRDELVPWKYEPRGTKTSVDQVQSEALSAMDGRIVNRNQVTFAEAMKVGLPVISFDSFADQNQQTQGYGIVSHGITSLTLTKSASNWWQTKYNIKSHYPQPIKAVPILEAIDEDFEFVIKRLEDDLKLQEFPIEFTVPEVTLPTEDGRYSIKSDSGIEHVIEKNVTITQVFDRGSTINPEYYLGVDDRGIKWPRALDAGFGTSEMKQAYGIDGFFQKGMQAVYHVEKDSDGKVIHYFKGGIPLSETRIVELRESPRLQDDVWVANVRTLGTFKDADGQTITIEPFNYNNVQWLDQGNVNTSLAAGDKVQISAPGNKKNLTPDGSYGPGEDKDGDIYIVNTAAPSTNFPAEVTTKPDPDSGRDGVIRSFSATGSTTYTDGEATGSNTYHIYFIGAEYEQVEVGDTGVVFQQRESGGDYRLYMLIVKPQFMGGDAFSG